MFKFLAIMLLALAPLPQFVDAPVAIAQTLRVRRISFANGANSTTINESVVRGERNVYLLDARQGQTLRITLNSTEAAGNALFDVISPDGAILESSTREFSRSLPTSGDYRVIVGGSRGNASFNMTISIN
jgi:hypothetical protein